jgi:hypothetical protein
VTAADCTWACGRLATSSQPLRTCCTNHTLTYDKVTSPYCAPNFWWTSASFTFSFTRNLMIQHCSTLRMKEPVLLLMWRCKGYSYVWGSDNMFPPSATKHFVILVQINLLRKMVHINLEPPLYFQQSCSPKFLIRT